MTIGEKIALRRKALGLTQTELAEKLGTTKQTIGKYEKGIVTNIPLSRVAELADALECTPEYLTGWEERREREQCDQCAMFDELVHLSSLFYRTLHSLKRKVATQARATIIMKNGKARVITSLSRPASPAAAHPSTMDCGHTVLPIPAPMTLAAA